ncbi:hypothetical protein [Cellulomonas sp. KH9]|uniref:hypothetical protein n=1 Tax=Cellulomonas sp. KH9 TaxID=1855324 RepID=UPI0008EABF68|nr:hypothetical protein [Cellulomonas sp. KH9]SFK32158.1 hypothetical protein SAMN05216467_2878 [Cellulomonas sp. KH9]
MTDLITRPDDDIEDESLADHIIDDLIAGDLVYYEPLSGQHWTNDMPGLVERVAELDRKRQAEGLWSLVNAARARGEATYAAGIALAAAVVESGGAA